MRGSYGTVYKITVEGEDYFIKKINFAAKDGDLTSIIKDEIETAIMLTKAIPEYVSNIKGARCSNIPSSHGYLIYEAPPGMNLREYITMRPPTAANVDLYNTLYIMIKRAQQAVNSQGYVHQDIKPENIYVIVDPTGNPVRCKLIDFGLTRPIGHRWTGQGTPDYMPANMIDKIRDRKAGRKYLPTNKSVVRHNDASVDIIWRRNFGRPDPPPHVGGSKRRRTMKHRIKKRTLKNKDHK